MRFKNKLYSLDAPTIDLCLSFFPSARFRSAKSGIKLHAVLDHDGDIPAFARTLTLLGASIVTADRAYIDFAWLYALIQCRNYLATRLKSNIKYRVIERRPVLKSKVGTSDQTNILIGTKAGGRSIPLRRIGYKEPNTGKQYFFLTNNLQLAAKTIADIYKARWKIELFFKWIKQNLKIKTFLGTSRNAVMTQIWIALITMLVLAYMKFLANLGQSITQIQRLLQLNLFKSQSLWPLFDPPPAEHKNEFRHKLLFNFS